MKKIWIVYEDCHGDVSYWSTKKKAYKEARKIIMSDPFYPYDGHRIKNKKEIADKEIEDYTFCVGVRFEYFEKSWLT